MNWFLLKTFLREGLSEPKFYCALVHKFKKLMGRKYVSFQFRNIITRYRRIGYNLNVMRQSRCLDGWVGRQTLWWHRPKAILFTSLGPELLVCCLAHWNSTGVFLLLRIFSKLFGAQVSPSSGSLLNLWALVFDSSGWLSWFICLSMMIHWLVRDSPRVPN